MLAVEAVGKGAAQGEDIMCFGASPSQLRQSFISCQKHRHGSKVKSGCRPGDTCWQHLFPFAPPSLLWIWSLLKRLPKWASEPPAVSHCSNFSSLSSSLGIFLRVKKPSYRGKDTSHCQMSRLGALPIALAYLRSSLLFCFQK